MRLIADLHIHSKYSRATSPKLIPAYLDRWARIKGINILGTGDCTHPGWLKDLKEQLEPAEEGFYTLKKNLRKDFDSGIALAENIPTPGTEEYPRFVLTGEISTIYSNGKTRKVHHVVILPDFKSAADFQALLGKKGNITSDGRPILGLDSRDLFEILLENDERSMLIPAHIWTPWFSALGARSGFDSIDECYKDLSKYIYAVETGLSSNPPMNWAVKSLDKFSIISNSDAHSPDKLGREATILEMDISYPSLVKALQRKDKKNDIIETIEFFPQEGKYHYDGHRNCNVYLSPEETIRSEGICPECKKPLTQGVMRRVMELAEEKVNEEAPCPKNYLNTNRRPYRSLIPLSELLSELLEVGVASKKVAAAYNSIISQAGSEFSLLLDLGINDIKKLDPPGIPGEMLATAIERMRSGNVFITPGYDGEFGVIRAFDKGEKIKTLDSPPLFSDICEKNKKTTTSKIPLGEHSPIKKKKTGKEKPLAETKPFALDPEQEKIILHQGSHSIIIAGPGTGKTAMLAYRIAKNIAQKKNAAILAVTFTVKAASELKERILKISDNNSSNVTTATFHSFCSSVLRKHCNKIGLNENFTIIDDNERSEILKKVLGKSKIKFQTLGKYIEERKKLLLLPGEFNFDTFSGIVPGLDLKGLAEQTSSSHILDFSPNNDFDILYASYRDYLKSLSSIDFDDLIMGVVRLFIKYPEILSGYKKYFKYIFVDEYQDVNFAQYVLIRLLVPGPNKSSDNIPELCVIGDPNQSIYGFRGSDKSFIERFLTDYTDAAIFKLTKSFRCAGPIINAAGHLMDTKLDGSNNEVNIYRFSFPSENSEAEGIARHISGLIGGTSFFAMDSGTAMHNKSNAKKKNSAPSNVNEENIQPEIHLKTLGECAILLRTLALSPPIEKALQNHGIPYQLVGSKFWLEEEKVKDILYIIKNTISENLQDNAIPLFSKATREKLRTSIIKDKLLPKEIVYLVWKIIKNKKAIDFKKSQKINLENLPDNILRLYNFAALYDNLHEFLDAVAISNSADDQAAKSDSVTIMTIHASKGLEFDHVFVAGLEEGILPFTLYENFKDNNKKQLEKIIEEEKRILYVAMTRARSGLYLSYSKSRFFQGIKLKNDPSRFLSKIEDMIPKYQVLIPKEKDKQLKLF
ncbi:MAG: UvrD-helicase domain-containing protein [Spirochaetaceae bacterium]|nr:UvrD-helicase domain-containing protein [Spirochaetaceae bacterium]